MKDALSQRSRRRFVSAFLAIVSGFIWVIPAGSQNRVNPLVFIPGFPGTQLVDERGDVAFGDAFSMARRFADVELPDEPSANKLRPGALIESISVFGLFSIKQYSGILATLGEMGYRRDTDLFVFTYDWRQSNFDTAKRLAEFVDSNPVLRGRRFDIVAHSMGGLVATIYINREGRGKVERLVTLGTPYYGSLDALRTYLEGWGALKNFLAGGADLVKRVAGSAPALYELMPRYANCCVLGAPNDPKRRPISLTDPSVWKALGWMPTDSRRAERVQHSLENAAELDRLVKLPDPVGTTVFRIAGSNVGTSGQVYISAKGDPIHWNETNGDGTVIEQSASSGDLRHAFTAIQVHATIFDDPHVKVQLRRSLRADDLTIQKFASQSPKAQFEIGGQRKAALDRITVNLGDTFRLVGDTVHISVVLHDDSGGAIPGLALAATVSHDGDTVQRLIEFQEKNGNYAADVPLTAAGTYRIAVVIPGVPQIERYVVALANPR